MHFPGSELDGAACSALAAAPSGILHLLSRAAAKDYREVVTVVVSIASMSDPTQRYSCVE